MRSLMSFISKLIEQNPSFFNEDYSLYNLKASFNDDGFDEKSINFFAENGVSARVSAYFDPHYYLSQYPDVTDAGMEPLEHFVNYGLYETRNPHPLIDMEVVKGGLAGKELTLETVAQHFIDNGRPSAYFDPNFYLNAYRDIAAAEIPALLHFIMAGANEKRLPNAHFNYDLYRQSCGKELDGIDLVIDFALFGDKKQFEFSKDFDYEHYLEVASDYLEKEEKLFRHYVLVGQELGLSTKKKLKLTGKSLISSGELYTALQQGVVDGAENNPPTFFLSRHYEVCKFFSLDEHTTIPDVLIMSTHLWDRLSEKEQVWMQTAADASVKYQRNLWAKAETEALEAVKKAGVTVIKPEKSIFQNKVLSMYDDYKDNKEIYELITKIKAVQ